MRNKHLLSVDLESWIFSDTFSRKKLSNKELKKLDDGYTLKGLKYLLKQLKKHNQKITFFVVTKLEEIYPGLIESILKEGHEVGWHTHTHALINSRKILLEELEASSKILLKYKIKGFQAPEIHFIKEGYKILQDYGFIYSSSIYGNSNSTFSFNGIYEIPVSVSKAAYKRKKNEIEFPSHMQFSKILEYGIPFGSSFFWGILGKPYYKRILNREENGGRVVNMFIHEWQLLKPTSREYKNDVSWKNRPLFLPYRINASALFEYLLKHYEFQTFNQYLKDYEERKKS